MSASLVAVNARCDTTQLSPAEIIERHRMYGWSEPVGEWGVIQSKYRADLKEALDRENETMLDGVLAEMFRGTLAVGLVSMTDPVSDLPYSVAWRMALWAKMTGCVDMEPLVAPEVGNPVVVYESSVPVMPDAPRFDHYARRCIKLIPDGGTVFEIGGGYGGVALQLLRASSKVRVVICDIPETLYIAGYWLSRASERSVGWFDTSPEADVVLLPAHELDSWTGDIDIVFSAHSLSGMDRKTVDGYMAWLEGSGAGYFYHDDVVRTVTDVWMTNHFPEILAEDITPPDCYELSWRESTPWMGLTDRFCEFMYARMYSG